jgi:hypothetical protein
MIAGLICLDFVRCAFAFICSTVHRGGKVCVRLLQMNHPGALRGTTLRIEISNRFGGDKTELT